MSERIILIQNDAADKELVRLALISPDEVLFEIEWIQNTQDGLRRLLNTEGFVGRGGADIAAVVVDLSAPRSAAIEAFDQLLKAAPQIPFLVLCVAQDEPIGKLAVQHGAQDYLLKGDLDGYHLRKTLRCMIDRAANAEALFVERERAQVTLNSIGDGVMSIDLLGNVTYLNAVAASMTGWHPQEAAGRAVQEVFCIIDADTRKTMQNPLATAIRENSAARLMTNCLLVRRDGVETPIEDSAAPIHDSRGQVTGAVMVFHDVSAVRAATLRMSYLAQHDSLTDLPNRLLLSDRLTQSISLAERSRQRVGLLFLDLDGFKHVNDCLGHTVGDRLLRSVAQCLRGCVRSSDTVSRQGGDEFVIMLPQITHARDAAFIADKVLNAIRQPHHLAEHDLHLTASIGIVSYPDDGADAETLLKNADFAMYQAKDAGRDNYQFFKPDLNLRAIERQSMQISLRQAVQHQEFSLYYQPKLSLQTGAIRGVEALIRWRHPQTGLIPPEQFIPVAEECGLIVPIGRWVLREACRQARAWLDAGLAPMNVAVNVSSVELRTKGFIAGLRAILAETGLDPDRLELELTETFLMQDSLATASVLGAIRNLGVHLALDDFGTGFSCLSYLKRFPIDALKIDRSFVRDLATDADNAGIVSAVISMGKNLNMRVIAEGVETRDQLEFLQEHFCPEGQGYYFAQPMVAGEVTQLIARHDRLLALPQSATHAVGQELAGRSFASG
jgi:diguanylate cyclase (GGDEF)-like protein/PAS domain S-box-containing protein